MPNTGITTKKRLLTFILIGLGCLLLLAGSLYWHTHRAPALFAKAVSNPKADVLGGALATAQRLHYVSLQPQAAAQLAQEGAEVRLPLFKGETYTFQIEQVSKNHNGSTTSVGSLKGQPESQAILVAGGGSIAGSIHFPDGRLCVIYPLPDQVLAVMEVSPQFQPDCRQPHARPIYSADGKAVMAFQTVQMDRATASGRANLRRPTSRVSEQPTATADLKMILRGLFKTSTSNSTTITITMKVTGSKSTPTNNSAGASKGNGCSSANINRRSVRTNAPSSGAIDILAAYTAGAVAKHGGVTNVENMINLAVAQANTAFQNSQISTRLQLVHAVQVQYSGSSISGALNAVTDGNGVMQQVHQLRKQHRADLVALFTEGYGSNAIGVAWLGTSSMPQYGFSVVELWATPMMTFAHEVGHNLGCAHNVGNKGIYSYSVGHRFTGSSGSTNQALYRTVMSYAPGTRVLHFSNPGVNYRGTATGVSDQIDNARTINQTAGTISRYSDGL